jgi:2-polyprenyl-6-methoxyphenol hydroxylase-like FAD-dependent oxidoreductase
MSPPLSLASRIAIVGGGVSGMTTAFALSQLGFRNVRVFERTEGGVKKNAHAHSKETALILASNGAAALRRLCPSLYDRLLASSQPLHSLAERTANLGFVLPMRMQCCSS